MPSPHSQPTRRAFLGLAAALPLTGCAGRTATTVAPAAAPYAVPPGAAAPAAAVETVHPRDSRGTHEELVELERRFDARLGLYALALGTGAEITHRADERFAFCSTFKALAAAAVLARNSPERLDTVVHYTADDLMASSSVTQDHVDTGMTLRQLCDAAVRYSDGTAGNLLLRDIGGPAALTAYTRVLGDTVTRMDRREPALAEAVPGDPRDTTSPRALGTDYRKIVLGDALPEEKRAYLRDLLRRNTTGDRRIRAGVPRGWTVADKTGTGGYGTAHDIGIVWPPDAAPVVIAAMSRRAAPDAAHDEALIAEAAAYVVAAFTGRA